MSTLRFPRLYAGVLLAASMAGTGCNDELANAYGDEDEPDDAELEPKLPDDGGTQPGDPDPAEGDEDGLGGEGGGEEPEGEDVGPGAPDPEQPGVDPVPPAECGNGIVEEGEGCDDGLNDGNYDSCVPGCLTSAGFCGDAELNGPEQCDDGNADSSDGCLSDCVAPESCLVIKQHDPDTADGFYMVAPGGLEPFEVWCDMTTDGGGYTFLKLDAGEPLDAPHAEAACAQWSMRLLIPRTQPHLYSAYAVATNLQIGPGAGEDYLRMLGVYPAFEGASCAHTALNSDTAACEWQAADEGPFWIGDRVDIGAPAGTGSLDGSMAYDFALGGLVETYAEIAGGGAESPRFVCDFGDKQ